VVLIPSSILPISIVLDLVINIVIIGKGKTKGDITKSGKAWCEVTFYPSTLGSMK
jgi:hypothetical protein